MLLTNGFTVKTRDPTFSGTNFLEMNFSTRGQSSNEGLIISPQVLFMATAILTREEKRMSHGEVRIEDAFVRNSFEVFLGEALVT